MAQRVRTDISGHVSEAIDSGTGEDLRRSNGLTVCGRTLIRALRPTFQSCIGNASHLQRFHSSLSLGLDYLSDPTAVQTSHPFATDIWNNYLNQTIPELQTLRPEDVGLDMNGAQH